MLEEGSYFRVHAEAPRGVCARAALNGWLKRGCSGAIKSQNNHKGNVILLFRPDCQPDVRCRALIEPDTAKQVHKSRVAAEVIEGGLDFDPLHKI